LEYHTLDVPWTGDQEAMVKWILHREPDFFEKQLPFVGYVQFRIETDRRIERIKMQAAWFVSSCVGYPNADVATEVWKTRDVTWRFEAR
jgi:hypothetical protein